MSRLFILCFSMWSLAVSASVPVKTQVLRTGKAFSILLTPSKKMSFSVDTEGKIVSVFATAPSHISRKALQRQLPSNAELISVSKQNKKLTFRIRTKTFFDATIKKHGTSWRVSFAPNHAKDREAEKNTANGIVLKQASVVTENVTKKLKSGKNKKTLPPLVPLTWKSTKEGQTLDFQWKARTNAAAFWKNNQLWIVFDKPARFQYKALERAAQKGEIRNLKVGYSDNAAWIRFVPTRQNYPIMQKKVMKWTVFFSPVENPIPDPLALSIDKQPFGRKVASIPVLHENKILVLTDTTFRDTFFVVPLSDPGVAYATQRQFVQFSILPAIQGIAIVPTDDKLKVQAEKNKIVISAQPDLWISDDPFTDDRLDSKFISLVGFYDWTLMNKPWVMIQEDLKRMVHKAKGTGRIQAVMDLARFYLTSGIEAEALDLLSSIKMDNPHMMKNASFVALYTIALLLDRQLEEAQKHLKNPLLIKDPEMRVWQGILHGLNGKWRDAQRDMKFALAFARGYPPEIKNFVLLLATEIFCMRGALTPAKKHFNEIKQATLSTKQQSYLFYVKGLMRQLESQDDKAVTLWNKAFERGDHFVKAKAGFALIQHKINTLKDLKQANIKEEIKKLEKLKYFWRGGYIEYEIMRKLAELYFMNNQYRDAIETLRLLRRDVKTKKQQKEVATQLLRYLEKVFLNHLEEVDTIKALALFEKYKSVINGSRNVTTILNKVVEKYVELTLFNRAIDSLQLLHTHLPSTQHYQNIKRQVALTILDHQPERALEMIKKARPKNVKEELEVRHLKSRAQMEMLQTSTALRTLENDHDVASKKIKALIYQSEENWNMAGHVFLELVNMARDGLSTADDLLLNAVICYTLAKNQERLNHILKTYKHMMINSPHKELFALFLDHNGVKKLPREETYTKIMNDFLTKQDELLKELALQRS